MVSPLYKLFLGVRSAFFWIFFLPMLLLLATLVSLIFFMPLSVRMGLVRFWIAYSLGCLKLFCGLNNIFDEKYVTVGYSESIYPMPERNAFGGMEWVF